MMTMEMMSGVGNEVGSERGNEAPANTGAPSAKRERVNAKTPPPAREVAFRESLVKLTRYVNFRQ
jgi:hypothetical protein